MKTHPTNDAAVDHTLGHFIQSGDRCSRYGNYYANFGKTAKQACYVCGGGVRDDDPFSRMGKVAIRSVSSRNYLDGRSGNTRQVWMTNRNPAGDDYLHWTIEKVDGNYAIKSVSSGNYLDGRNSSYASRDGAVLVTNRNPKGDVFLQWKIESVDGKYALKSISSGLYLDGRNPEHLGDQVWLTPRRPQGDKYLQWTISSQD